LKVYSLNEANIIKKSQSIFKLGFDVYFLV
jgi:hypothetical protein